MPGCCVYGCSHRTDEVGVKTYLVPKIITNSCAKTLEVTQKRRAAWLRAIARTEVPPNARVCSLHFHSGKPSYHMNVNDPDWAPSLCLHQSVSVSGGDAKARFDRLERRSSGVLKPSVNDDVDDENENGLDLTEEVDVVPGIACQTDFTCDDIIELEKKVAAMEVEVKFPRCYTEETMKESDFKVKTYTGLPSFLVLISVFKLVSDFIKTKNKNSSLSAFEEFMMVLMRLRLNLIEDDLAFRFHVTQGTVSKIINRWLPVMSKVLSSFIIWPDRETLKATMPQCFRNSFGTSVTVIIDCFEIFVQRPSTLKARAQTWSDYKHHNTVKYLIGITPQGTISFISRGWGGRTSDKFITEAISSGFLDHLKPGDVILADRGSNIGEAAGVLQARLVVPAYMNGRSQLSATDIDETRDIARVRIHVERVIGLLRRKFRILSELLSVSALQPQKEENLSRIDQIVMTCCGLCNLCPPIIPLDVSPRND